MTTFKDFRLYGKEQPKLLLPSSIQTITVGLGVSPNHALYF